MNRRIIEIDAEIARLRGELLEKQNRIQGLAEERGRVLAALEEDTAFMRKVKEGQSRSGRNGAR
jgi:hypothetical protein